jgi:glycosyltransferase involved in cell wall biosynthesis
MGGIETVVRQLVTMYSRQGHEVHVCSGARPRSISSFPRAHSYYPLGTIFSQFLWPLQPLFVLSLAMYLIALHIRYRFDVFVPQDSYLQGKAAIIAGRVTRRPVVVMDHGVATNIADARWQRAWKQRHRSRGERIFWPLFDLGVVRQPGVFRYVATHANRLFYTGYELDEFYRHHQADRGKIRTYDHVIDVDFFSPPPSAAGRLEIRRRLGVGADEFVINCTSRLNFEKGYREIINAFAALVREAGGRVLLLVGGDDRQVHQRTQADGEKQVILSLIEALDVSQNVRLLGVLNPEQIRDLHRASDLHIYAGTMGCSFALCVLEAMSCGLPTVVTSVPRKLADVVTPNIGWVVPPADEKRLEAALLDAYRSRHELPAKGTQARRYAETHNSFDAASRTYEEAMFAWTA